MEGANTWRCLTEEELARPNKEVIPLALILSRKRDGSFKARACALGNLVTQDGVEVYAPTVGMVAQRMLLVEIASARDHCAVFDLDCAFLNAPLKEEVYI